MYCEDCGCRLSAGICSNCQEELYILEYQGDYIEEISQEFKDKVNEQRRIVKAKNKIMKQLEGGDE